MLGYNDDEIKIMISEHFVRNIVNNITIEQAQEITKIFGDNDFSMYLNDGYGVEHVIAWKQLGIDWIDEPPKAYYCDKPLVSREHLADLSISKKFNLPIQESLFNKKPVVKCLYCGSENVRKISGTERTISVLTLGFLSSKINKSFKCNDCGGTF